MRGHVASVALIALALPVLLQTPLQVFGQRWPASSSLAPLTFSTAALTTTIAARQEPQASRSKICQVTNGESVAIVEIEESNGNDISQQTSPLELPIHGARDDIELRIESATLDVFEIQGKRLRLVRPLNRDAQLKEAGSSAQQQPELASQPVLSVYLQVSCHDRRQQSDAAAAARSAPPKVIIPVLVKVLDINDNAPKFAAPVYSSQLSELAPLQSVVFEHIYALDLDASNNGLLQYSISSAPPRDHSPAAAAAGSQELGSQSTVTIPVYSAGVSGSTVSSSSSSSGSRRWDTTTPSNIGSSSPMADDHTRMLSMELMKRARSSTRRPEASIDLDNEPIFNGPTEVSDSDADALEVAGGASDDSDDDTGGSTNSTSITGSGGDDKARRRKRRRRNVAGDQQRPRSNSWTNLMADEEAQVAQADAAPLDSSEYFALELNATTGRPVIRLRKQLDYETKRLHRFYLVATDRANKQAQRSGYTTLVVRVLDGDDQGPVFVQDQSGCSTGALTSTTSAVYTRRSLDTEQTPGTGSGEFKLPKGFHVTEDEFEFGDAGKLSGLEEGKLLPFQSAPPESGGPKWTTTTAAQKVPTQTGGYLKMASERARCPQGQELAGALVEYQATTVSGQVEHLRISPQPIKARDGDELNAPISYSFLNGTPSDYHAYFQINPLDGTVKQTKPVEIQRVQRFVVYVEAQEQTPNRLSSLARLVIEVVPSERGEPVLVANSRQGWVEENSPVGAPVMTEQGGSLPLRFILHNSSTSDLYQFETTNDAFKVNQDGLLVVNRWPLDRDPPQPATHKFQVAVRTVAASGSTSITTPVDVNVTLIDLNDNPPVIANSSLAPLQLSASGSVGATQPVRVIQVLDADEDPANTKCTFAIVHVSNGARDRFQINADSGLLETRGPFKVGEQLSVTLQVSDALARTNQGILELTWVPGLNSPPYFLQLENAEQPAARSDKFVVQVSEAAPVNTSVAQMRARDPDNEPLSYSIVGGNVNADFQINPKTGTIQLAKPLDREEVSSYLLQVEARDSRDLTSVRPITVQVLDINDQNPVFASTNYTFQVEEGPAALARPFGSVQASDSDLGPNGQVSYRLEPLSAVDQQDGRPLFAINESSGELSLLKPLDYERARSHILTVSAIDSGRPPRVSTQSIQVLVGDMEDEAPYFEVSAMEVELPENAAPGQQVAQVQAVDLDSKRQVTYQLVAGNASLFSVDPGSGRVTTLSQLDHEEKQVHLIRVGLKENDSTTSDPKHSATCEIRLKVLDLNDNAPQFAADLGPPVRVLDTVPLGEQVTRVVATDADSSAANSDIRYELSGRSRNNESLVSEPCSRSFMIDATSGVVAVKSDLKLERSSECNLVVCATDSGLPNPRDTCTRLTVFIDHLVDSQSASVGFSQAQYSLEVGEDLEADKLIKVLGVVHKTRGSQVLAGCDVVSGDDQSVFYARLNDEADCELRSSRDARNKLDYESKRHYSLTLRLNIPGFVSPQTLAQVQVSVLDVNDNAPIFQPVPRYMHLTQNRYLASVASDAPSESQVLQLVATDADLTRTNGHLSYELLDEHLEPGNRFKVNPSDGIVRTSRPVEDVAERKLPLRLRVVARDNPEPPVGRSLESAPAEVLVNLIDDRHRVALVVRDTSTSQVLEARDELLAVLQARVGLIAAFERAESLKLLTNGTLEPDVSGTDFWFHLIEPGSFRVIETDDPRVRSALFEERSRSSLLDVIGQTLGFTKTRLRLPYISLSRNPSASMHQQQTGFARGLVWFGIGLSIAIVLVLVCQCTTWKSTGRSRSSRFVNEKPPLFSYYPPMGHTLPTGKGPLPGGFLPGTPEESTLVYGSKPAFFTNGGYPQHHQTDTLKQAPGAMEQTGNMYQLQDHQLQYNSMSKEYETQMLKLSVLFDDSQSVAGADHRAAGRAPHPAIPHYGN